MDRLEEMMQQAGIVPAPKPKQGGTCRKDQQRLDKEAKKEWTKIRRS